MYLFENQQKVVHLPSEIKPSKADVSSNSGDASMLQVSSQPLLMRQILEGTSDGSSISIPTSDMGNLHGIPGSQLWPDPGSATEGTSKVSSLFLCLPLKQIKIFF